jgi:hypothetical protein
MDDSEAGRLETLEGLFSYYQAEYAKLKAEVKYQETLYQSLSTQAKTQRRDLCLGASSKIEKGNKSAAMLAALRPNHVRLQGLLKIKAERKEFHKKLEESLAKPCPPLDRLIKKLEEKAANEAERICKEEKKRARSVQKAREQIKQAQADEVMRQSNSSWKSSKTLRSVGKSTQESGFPIPTPTLLNAKEETPTQKQPKIKVKRKAEASNDSKSSSHEQEQEQDKSEEQKVTLKDQPPENPSQLVFKKKNEPTYEKLKLFSYDFEATKGKK